MSLSVGQLCLMRLEFVNVDPSIRNVSSVSLKSELTDFLELSPINLRSFRAACADFADSFERVCCNVNDRVDVLSEAECELLLDELSKIFALIESVKLEQVDGYIFVLDNLGIRTQFLLDGTSLLCEVQLAKQELIIVSLNGYHLYQYEKRFLLESIALQILRQKLDFQANYKHAEEFVRRLSSALYLPYTQVPGNLLFQSDIELCSITFLPLVEEILLSNYILQQLERKLNNHLENITGQYEEELTRVVVLSQQGSNHSFQSSQPSSTHIFADEGGEENIYSTALEDLRPFEDMSDASQPTSIHMFSYEGGAEQGTLTSLSGSELSESASLSYNLTEPLPINSELGRYFSEQGGGESFDGGALSVDYEELPTHRFQREVSIDRQCSDSDIASTNLSTNECSILSLDEQFSNTTIKLDDLKVRKFDASEYKLAEEFRELRDNLVNVRELAKPELDIKVARAFPCWPVTNNCLYFYHEDGVLPIWLSDIHIEQIPTKVLMNILSFAIANAQDLKELSEFIARSKDSFVFNLTCGVYKMLVQTHMLQVITNKQLMPELLAQLQCVPVSINMLYLAGFLCKSPEIATALLDIDPASQYRDFMEVESLSLSSVSNLSSHQINQIFSEQQKVILLKRAIINNEVVLIRNLLIHCSIPRHAQILGSSVCEVLYKNGLIRVMDDKIDQVEALKFVDSPRASMRLCQLAVLDKDYIIVEQLWCRHGKKLSIIPGGASVLSGCISVFSDDQLSRIIELIISFQSTKILSNSLFLRKLDSKQFSKCQLLVSQFRPHFV